MIYRKIFLATFLIAACNGLSLMAQDVKKDSTGLPGDNFSLQGALELFSKAANPEAFEKALNEEKNNVNNLDLNGDGKIDYIRVVDKKENDLHAIVLQAVISKDENQDIAVIEIEKKGNKDAMAQIVGDEDIYGKETYLEPRADDGSSIEENPNKAKKGPAASEYNAPVRIYFNVWAWPCVRYIYDPVYVVYVSPWYWYTYPRWWNPWRPMYWHNFYPRTWGYHRHCHYINEPRFYGARKVYAPHRTESRSVRERNERVVNNYRTTNKIVVNKKDSRDRGRNDLDTRDRNNSNTGNVRSERDSRGRGNDGKLAPRDQTTRSSERQNTGNGRQIEPGRNRNDGQQTTPRQRDQSSQPQSRPQRSDIPQRSERPQNSSSPRNERSNAPQRSSGRDQSAPRQERAPRSEQRMQRSQQRSESRMNSKPSAPSKPQGSSGRGSSRSGNR